MMASSLGTNARLFRQPNKKSKTTSITQYKSKKVLLRKKKWLRRNKLPIDVMLVNYEQICSLIRNPDIVLQGLKTSLSLLKYSISFVHVLRKLLAKQQTKHNPTLGGGVLLGNDLIKESQQVTSL